jgi:O-antigen/teichoic acid export membrane protein
MTKNIAKSALWVTVSEVFFNLSGFIIHSALGRFMGPSDYGTYGLIITLTTTVIILIGNGIPTAMAKYISEFFETDAKMVLVIKKQAVIAQIILISGITLVFYFSAGYISEILGDMRLVPLFQISTLIIPAFALASFYFSYYTGLHRFNLQATLKTIRSFFRILFVVSLAFFFSVKGAVIGYILAPFSVFVVAYAIDRFKIRKELSVQAQAQPKDYYPKFETKKLLNYAWQIIFFFLAYELLISIDLYMVKGISHDSRITGIYNAVLTVGRIPYYIFYAMTIFLLPMISQTTSEKNHKKTREIINQSLRIMLLLLVPMIILMAVFSEPILFDFYGKKYISGASAMSILEYGVGFLTIFYVLSFVMNGAGKTKIPMWISLFGVALNVILNYFLIKKFSIIGSAIATSITSFVITILMLYFLYQEFGAFIKLKSLWKTFIGGILLYFLATYCSQGPIISIFWSIALFAFYLMFLYVIGELSTDDITYAKALIKRKKNKRMEEAFSGNEPEA